LEETQWQNWLGEVIQNRPRMQSHETVSRSQPRIAVLFDHLLKD